MSILGLQPEGLTYVNEETGEQELIPRANVQDGYKYTIEQTEKKEHLMMMCLQKFPALDKMTVELFCDRYMNYKEEMEDEMRNDKEYMKKFKV